HLNLLVDRPGPISRSGDFKRHDAVVNNTVFRREALEELDADVAHGFEEFAVVLRNILLSGEGSIQAIEGRSVPDDVVGVKVERRFDFIDSLTVKVLLDARQVSSNTVLIHRFLLCIPVVTNALPGTEPRSRKTSPTAATLRAVLYQSQIDVRTAAN